LIVFKSLVASENQILNTKTHANAQSSNQVYLEMGASSVTGSEY